MTRLVIIADHSLVAHSIRLALRQTAGFDAVGVLDGRASVGAMLPRLRPDVVVVDDMHQPRADDPQSLDRALARLREAADQAPAAQRLLLTLNMDDERLDEAFEAGAHAVMSKDVHPVSLGTMLREVVRGNVVHRGHSRRRTATPDCDLTMRERQILALVAEGQTNGQIAQLLWVTEQTVKFHLSNTYRKLGVANRTEASHYAHVNDLVATGEVVAC
jgi:DNA-binding NarL/FixJ family response regulator